MAHDFTPGGPESSNGTTQGGRRLARFGSFVAVAAIALGVVIFASACGGGGSKNDAKVSPTSNHSAGLATDELPTPVGTPLSAEPTVTSAPSLTGVGANDRLVVAKYGISAPLTYKVVGSDGVMPNPNGADDVAYYNFESWPGKGGAPGQGGNSVFAGHVDSGRTSCKNGSVPPPCQAVFWDIGKLSIGDEIEVVVGGNSFKYRVTSNAPVHAETGDWDSIVSARAQETITLITCGGDFNPQTREYTHRQVVVAVRI